MAATLAKMTLDEQIGQMLFPSLNAAFTSADSDVYDRLDALVRELKVGGIHVFGSGEPLPGVLLNPMWGASGASRKGDALAASALLNRLQRASAVPLLATADFEGGGGYILNGATRFPRAMALGAARDPELACLVGEAVAKEGRALGVHVDFYPVVDVNNNPRNPIINIRSFGEDPAFVSEMGEAYLRGIRAGGMLSTAKHFPGHGDTATDTHLGLARIDHPRSRLDEVELAPFRAAVRAGVDAVMSSHIVLPALDAEGLPATLSRPILTGLLRGEMGFDGLIFTDSMAMHAISKTWPPGEAAAMAVRAGADIVLHPPGEREAFEGIKAAVLSGRIDPARVRESAERILRAKSRLGLHRERLVSLDEIDMKVGGRQAAALASRVCERALTLVRDDRGDVPLGVPREANVLFLSVLDYPSGWREAAPNRAFVPALRERWPNVTAVEISDRTTASEMELVRTLALRSDAVVASVFVRIASYSGRMDLAPAAADLLNYVSGLEKPFVAVIFGNPYVAMALPKVPAVLLTYEYLDAMEVAAVRALAGEIPIGGKLPVTMPGLYEAGHGLVRPVALSERTASGPAAR